jgi:hypothetical protein
MNKSIRTALLRHSIGFQGLRALGIAGLLGVILAGCAGAPYVDARREAGQREPVGPSTLNRVAICYSSGERSKAAVQQLAEAECAKTSRVPKDAFEQRWGCTMLAPRRIFFDCVPKP